jgi:hypothetical protein
MDIYGQIALKIKQIAGNGKLQQAALFPAQVEKVEGALCTVKLDEFSISDVRLRAVINENEDMLLIRPKEGSYVLVADLSGGDYRDLAVIEYSEVESVHLKIQETVIDKDKEGIRVWVGETVLEVGKDAVHIETGETTADMDKNGIVFNGGELKGLVKIEVMIDWMSKLYQDLQTLKNQLLTQPVAGQGAPLNLVFNPVTPQPELTDFENEKVKQ